LLSHPHKRLAMAVLLRALLLWGVHAVTGTDVESMIQSSLSAQGSQAKRASSGTTSFSEAASQEMKRLNMTEAAMSKAVTSTLAAVRGQASTRAAAGNLLRDVRQALGERERRLKKAWEKFLHSANASGMKSTPQELLEKAKAALTQTHAMSEMQDVVREVSQSLAEKPADKLLGNFDSLMVGVGTTLAPWNYFLLELDLRLTKTQWRVFLNFKVDEPWVKRLCFGVATATDTKYGSLEHKMLNGIELVAGASKWENIPGWSFGVGDVVDPFTVPMISDFGWKWTLSTHPESQCMYFDVGLIDSDALPLPEPLKKGVSFSALQTSLHKGAKEEALALLHGSLFFEHTWCTEA